MVVGEAAAVAVLGYLLAIGPAMLGGRELFDRLRDSGQVKPDVHYAFSTMALGTGFAITLLASVGAAFLAMRRAARAAEGRAPRQRLRNVARGAALVAGAVSVSSTYAFDADAPALMAAPAYGAILLSVGFATFSSGLLRAVLAVFGGPVAALTGAPGHLAVRNMRRRAGQLSGVLMPLILFTGMAAGTLYMQAVENHALDASGVARSIDDKNTETLNLVVVGIIVAFSCIMLVNSLYAATVYRRREFGGQRLAGATPGQVLSAVGVEGVLLTVTGVFFGTVAGAAGLLVFTDVRTGSFHLTEGPSIWLAIAAIATAAVLLTTALTARRAIRVLAVEATASV